MKKAILTLLVLLMGVPQAVAQGVTFDAKVSKRTLGLNERLRVCLLYTSDAADE